MPVKKNKAKQFFIIATCLSLLMLVFSFAIAAQKPSFEVVPQSEPTVGGVAVTPAIQDRGSSVVISATIVDVSGISYARAQIKNGAGVVVATINLYDDGAHSDGVAGDNIFASSWTIPVSFAAGNYGVFIVAVDTLGYIYTNAVADANLTVTIPACVPSKTCADYPDQCGTNLSNGCADILDCSGSCIAPKICNALGQCAIPTCVNNDFDGYDTCNIGDLGDDGKTKDCDDSLTGADGAPGRAGWDDDAINGIDDPGETNFPFTDDGFNIHPSAAEVCGNGIDEDCNGSDLACPGACPNGTCDVAGGECSTCAADCACVNPGDTGCDLTGKSFCCGNFTTDTSAGETCDVADANPANMDLNGKDCASFGYTGGIFGCRWDCKNYDPSSCTGAPGTCGNNICDAGENCVSCPTECCPGCGDICFSLGYECGIQTVCGTPADCGGCIAPEICDAGGQCVAPGGCVENWVCNPWLACAGGIQIRDCGDLNACGTIADRPSLSQSCVVPPASFDWRNVDGVNWMTPVKDQGACNSCAAFSELGAVEAEYNIEMNDSNLDVDLSEQDLISCSGTVDCTLGGNYWDVSMYIKNTGIVNEGCFSYSSGATGVNGACAGCLVWTTLLWKMNTFVFKWPATQQEIKNAIVNAGPVMVAMNMDIPAFGGWNFATLGCTDDVSLNHGVVIVGYNDVGGYWIVRNSWGAGWWDGIEGGGYFRVLYGECGIESYLSFPEGITSP